MNSAATPSLAARALRTRLGLLHEVLASDKGPFGFVVGRPHDLLLTVALAGKPGAASRRVQGEVVLVPARVWDHGRDLLAPFLDRVSLGTAMFLIVGRPALLNVASAIARGVGGILSEEPSREEVFLTVQRAFELMAAKAHAADTGRSLLRYHSDAEELVEIARAMTTERDVHRLLGLILEKARLVTCADAGSIYVTEQKPDGTAQLRFKLTQNDSLSFDSREFTVPISNRSMAGCSALEKKTIEIADVYDLPPGSPYKFDRSFDGRTTYRTQSMLTVPLISQRDEVIGVIQLINKKREPRVRLVSKADFEEQVVPFDAHSKNLLGMLAAQAGASLETAMLYAEIHNLFEGFVRASVEAIESRDPTTSGHSRRVAEMTVGLARIVSAEETGPFRDAFFSAGDLREIEYASLLHDFGKIGVREKVLVKAKKLYEEQLSLLRSRFDYVAKAMEASVLRRKVHANERVGAAQVPGDFDAELAEQLAVLERSYAAIVAANEPTVLSSGDFARIESLAAESFTDLRGDVQPLVSCDEVAALKIRQGSLTVAELDEIRSHVTHTHRFLSQIPWGKSFSRVPLIAGAHHERPNGTGYPKRLHGEEIPIQSKMMSVADVFDALTAHDRPYKRAVPVERAIDILEYNANDGHLDGDLVRIFKEARVWEKCGVTGG